MTRATPELRRYLSAAEQAAKAAGAIIRNRVAGVVERKGDGDYVTQADRDAEKAIGRTLLSHTPDIPVVGEEFGGHVADRYWLVDPIDGTTNFLRGFPVVGVSIALIERGRPVVGVVSAPLMDELYTAVRDGGAHLTRDGGKPVRLGVSERPPSEAVVATGFPFRDRSRIDRHLRMLRACLERFEDLRRPGAASLDLAWTAAGIFDGFFELGLSPWDVAAGVLLVQEAGGRVSDWDGSPDVLSGNILAGSPAVQAELSRAARATAEEPEALRIGSAPPTVASARTTEDPDPTSPGGLFGQLG